MKFCNSVIQRRNISKNTLSEFLATYKGKQISITTNHNLGKPNRTYLGDFYKRFSITVIDLKSGMLDVDTYLDEEHITDAILYALKGAQILNTKQ